MPLRRRSSLPQISVVIPTLGNYDMLRRVLEGYARQTVPLDDFEVLVVADAADADVEAVDRIVAAQPLRARRLTGTAPGASANRNVGLAAAAQPIVLFTDNDTVPDRRLVYEHASWHARHPDAVTGVLGHVKWARELRVTTFMRWLDRGVQFDFNIHGIEAHWGQFVTANASLKRDFARRVGDFDQAHFPYGYEDTDWAYRASKLGFRLLYNRRAVVHHLRPMTLEFWQRRARRVAASEYTYVQLYPEMSPWFHGKFTSAQEQPRSTGRGIRLAPYVAPWVPWLGPHVWRSVDLTYSQAIAPHFLEAWGEVSGQAASTRKPDLSEFDQGG